MTESQIIIRLIVAAIVGTVIGFERELRGHAAGLRTHTLVCLGSTLIMVTNIYLYETYHDSGSPMDVTRMAAQVVSGIGFLGAGTIIRSGINIKGLTTAATLWISAALGLACGSGFWVPVISATIIILVFQTIFRSLKFNFLDKRNNLEPNDRD